MLSYWLNGTINLILPNCFPFPTQKNKPPQLQTEGSFLANISQVSWATLCCVAETAQPQSLVAKALAFLQRLCWYDTFANAILEKTLLQRSSWQDPFAKAFMARPFCMPSWKDPFAKAFLERPFCKGLAGNTLSQRWAYAFTHACTHRCLHCKLGGHFTKAPPQCLQVAPFCKGVVTQGCSKQSWPLKAMASSLLRFSFFKACMFLPITLRHCLLLTLLTSTMSLLFSPISFVPAR